MVAQKPLLTQTHVILRRYVPICYINIDISKYNDFLNSLFLVLLKCPLKDTIQLTKKLKVDFVIEWRSFLSTLLLPVFQFFRPKNFGQIIGKLLIQNLFEYLCARGFEQPYFLITMNPGKRIKKNFWLPRNLHFLQVLRDQQHRHHGESHAHTPEHGHNR